MILLPVMLLVGCQRPAETRVDGAWVRLAAAPGRPAGGYFTLHGGGTDRTLTGVATAAPVRIELHETITTAAGMTMQPVGQVALPAGGQIAFAPGGKHLMLFDVPPNLRPGSRLPLEFRFADGKVLHAQAMTIAAGDPPPAF